MLFKLFPVLALAAVAVAAPQRAQPPIDARNPQRAQPPIDTIDARTPQRAQPPIDAIDARNLRRAQPSIDARTPQLAQPPIDTIDARDPQRARPPIDTIDTRDPQRAQPPIDARTPQRAQPPIDSINARTPQRAQPPIDARTPQRAQPPIDARNTLVTRDARNCTFTVQITERCRDRPTVTKITYAKVSNLLTPSMSAVPVPTDEKPISGDPFTISITSRNELIDGKLSIARLPGGDGKVHFAWDWVNPTTHAPEIVNWTESDDGAETRYGCRLDQAWSKNEIKCDKIDPADQRDLALSCFFKCRN